jgi:hypothetical protein
VLFGPLLYDVYHPYIPRISSVYNIRLI